MSEDTGFVTSKKDKTIYAFRSEVDNHLAPNVTLISSDNAKVKGHSNILASCHYFKGLFNTDKTGNSHLVFHENFTGDVLELVVKYIYIGEYSLLDADKLPEVIRATSKERFNIPALAKGYLLKQLDAPEGLNQANWHILYKSGIKLSLGEEFCNRIYEFLKEKHTEFYKSEEFKGLSFDQICKIMKSPNRPFESNMTIMEATLIWATENKAGMDKLAELSKIYTNPVQNGNPQAALPILDGSIQSANCSFSIPQPILADPHCSTTTERTRSNMVDVYHPPKYSWDSAQLLFFGPDEESESIYLLSYTFKSGEIKKMAKLPIEDLMASSLSLLVSRDRIYSIGGLGETREEGLDLVWSFPIGDLENLDKAWDEGPKLNMDRYNALPLLYRNTIYNFASHDLEIEKWDMEGNPGIWENNNWDMLYDRFFLGVAFLDNIIYMIGGDGAKKNQVGFETGILDSGESYNIDDGTQTLLPNMIQARYHLKVVPLEDRIYAIGGVNDDGEELASVESYKPGDPSWSQVASMNHPRREMGAFVLDGMIYVVGGNYEALTTPTMERYCPQEDRWTMVDINLPEWAELSSSALLGPNNF